MTTGLILLIYYSLGIIFLIGFKVCYNLYGDTINDILPYNGEMIEDMLIIAMWIFFLILLLFVGLYKGINIISDKLTNWILSFNK